MFWINTKNQKYGPFGDYANALEFARSRWIEKEFHIVGSCLETFFTLGLDPVI